MTSDTSTATTLPALRDGQATSAGLSRRSMLTGIGLTGLGALTATQLFGRDTAVAATPPPAATPPKPAGRRRPKPTKQLVQDANGNFVQPGPFTVQATCDLTEDYFLTSEVILNLAGGDRVIPFVNPMNNNAVEAIVFTQGNTDAGTPGSVTHLQRNLAVTSGWSYTQLDLSSTVPYPADVAVAANGSNVYLMVLAEEGTGPGPAWLTQLDSATAWDSGYVASYYDLGFDVLDVSSSATWGPLQGGVDPSGNPYFYSALVDGSATYLIGYIADEGWASNDLNYQYLQGLDSSSVSVADYIVIFDTSGSATPVGYSLVLTSDGALTGYAELAYVNQQTAQFDSDNAMTTIGGTGVAELIWAWATPGSNTGQPGYAIQQNALPQYGLAAGTIFVDESGNDQTLSDQASVGANAASVWQADGLYTVNLLGPDDTLTTTAQYDDNGPTWGAGIPIGVGLSAVFGVPTDPNEATLFAVDAANVLNVLTNSATGWTQEVVHQDAATSIEVPSWRCLISLDDANGAGIGIGHGSVQLSTDSPVGLWHGNTSSILLPGAPITLAGDRSGEFSISIPTAELDTATLTAQALDANGNATGQPLTIVPNTDVHNFFTGPTGTTNGGLASVGGTLTGSALTSAQNKTWNTSTQSYQASGALLPGLSSVSADAANQMAAAMNHVMSLPSNTGTAAQSGFLDFTTNPPTFVTSTDPTAYDAHKTGDTHWWDKAVNDIEAAFRGLRHAAIAVKQMVTTWASDVKQWTINLVVDIGDGLDHLMNWVVKTAEDAVHAISSFFHSLGADIKAAWNWLKNLVLGVIKDADPNAQQLATWFDDLTTAGDGVLTDMQTIADGFFQSTEAWVTDKIGILQSEITGTPVSASAQQPAPLTDTGSSDWGKAFTAVEDVFKVLQHSPASWLWNKIKSHIQPVDSDNLNFDPSTYTSSCTDLTGNVNSNNSTAQDLLTTLKTALQTYTTAQSFNGSDMGTLFGDLGNLTNDVLKLMDLVVDDVLGLVKDILNDLHDLLTSEFQIPLVGEILELAGIDFDPSIVRVTTLIAAYPATLIHNLWVGEDALFTFNEQTDPGLLGRGAGEDKNGFGLNIAAAVVQFFWADVDVVMDVLSLPSKEDSPAQDYDDALNVLDFTLPIAMTILQWPAPISGPTPAPCSLWNFDDATVWGKHNTFLYGIIITTIAPWFFQGLTWIINKVAPWSIYLVVLEDWAVPVLQTITAAANNILGAWWQYDNIDPSSPTLKTDKTNAVLDWTIPNLSYVDAPLGMEEVVDASEGVTAGVKLVIDAIANYGGVAFCIQGAIASHDS